MPSVTFLHWQQRIWIQTIPSNPNPRPPFTHAFLSILRRVINPFPHLFPVRLDLTHDLSAIALLDRDVLHGDIRQALPELRSLPRAHTRVATKENGRAACLVL